MTHPADPAPASFPRRHRWHACRTFRVSLPVYEAPAAAERPRAVVRQAVASSVSHLDSGGLQPQPVC